MKDHRCPYVECYEHLYGGLRDDAAKIPCM